MKKSFVKSHILFLIIIAILLALTAIVSTVESAQVDVFTPVGTVKNVRQVAVRFSEQIVPFGNPFLKNPFVTNCTDNATGRWIDGKNWSYDFTADLPAGIVCNFKLKDDIKTLSGKTITGKREFSFSTGGPSVIRQEPYEGAPIEEEQTFAFTLDAPADEKSMMENVYCSVNGIGEKIGISLLDDKKKKEVIKTMWVEDRKAPMAIFQCKRAHPPDKEVKIVWGKGVKSKTGAATTADQTLTYKTRPPFTITFECQRERPEKQCIPLTPMKILSSAPIPWSLAKEISLKSDSGKTWKLKDKEAHDNDTYVTYGHFEGPFPEKSAFSVILPANVKDDSGRLLSNSDKFPLKVLTDEYPPLAKFSSRFGILELNASPALPITVRNIENTLKGAISGEVKGEIHHSNKTSEEDTIKWLRTLSSAVREKPILTDKEKTESVSIPLPGAGKEFEVVGIPLKTPGFHIVELQSNILGKHLLENTKTMYVQAGALVTNLSAHFKWGRESSIVWVTTLDTAEPVKDADVTLRDCNGKIIWQGKTDESGVARINKEISSDKLPYSNLKLNYTENTQSLNGIGGGLFVFAKKGSDLTFIHSSWDEGIEPWRFNLFSNDYSQSGKITIHTIFDRTLFRAGEIVHFKHVARKRTGLGFALVKTEELPTQMTITHRGSEQSYTIPIKWNSIGHSEGLWQIPRDAKLGNYESLLSKSSGKSTDVLTGTFKVEEFRVPLMRGQLTASQTPLIKPKDAAFNVSATYLSGGGASKLPVKVRAEISSYQLHFPDYEDFTFSGNELKEGIETTSGDNTDDDTQGETIKKEKPFKLETLTFNLDGGGGGRAVFKKIPEIKTPAMLLTELEYSDPNGEVQTVSTHTNLYPSKHFVGIKTEGWVLIKDTVRFQAVVVDTKGKPVANATVKAGFFQRKTYSHRRRITGGFYGYSSVTEIKKIGSACEGKTNAQGLLICNAVAKAGGNIIIEAVTTDDAGNKSFANTEFWVSDGTDWWNSSTGNSDRIDVIAEKKKYEAGDTARFQVKMPFREATVLVSVEREGVIDYFVKKVSGKEPVLEFPVKNNYSPNVYVSVFAVRGRIGEEKPGFMFDPGKPAYKFGLSKIRVGWKPNTLSVAVKADKETYKIRSKAKVHIKVETPDGKPVPVDTEAAVAAVDEGLLELYPNSSWDLLKAMMGERPYEVVTSTAQMMVVGKRHFGKKALPHGGGGGRQITRELFDTLLFWKGTVKVDSNGEANVEIPLNDSLTAFKILAVASSGTSLFGTGETTIKSSQDLILFAGTPPIVREGDNYRAGFTVRNGSDRSIETDINLNLTMDGKGGNSPRDKTTVKLAPGEAKDIGWEITVPYGVKRIDYEVNAKELSGAASDKLKKSSTVLEAVKVRTFQSTLAQIKDKKYSIEIEKPASAVSEKGGIDVKVTGQLSRGLDGVSSFMSAYPYTCLEQRISKAVALKDKKELDKIMETIPAYLDKDGFAKYFPTMLEGSDVLTSYILSILNEAGYKIPEPALSQMLSALTNFVEGKIIRSSALPTADVSIRKLAAIEAISSYASVKADYLKPITIEPNLWPTSALLDWINILRREHSLANRDTLLKEAKTILRSRMNIVGTFMGLSKDANQNLFWLMSSPDTNTVKALLTVLPFDDWKEDVVRIANGTVQSLKHGHWSTTVANAWGVVAMDKFSAKFENTKVTGITSAALGDKSKKLDFNKTPKGGTLSFGWQETNTGKGNMLSVVHNGNGAPWVTVSSLAAIALKEPVSTGYRIKKTVEPVQQKTQGKWTKGDVASVTLEIDAQSDMTWVAVADPIPAGSSILGSGLKRSSAMLSSANNVTTLGYADEVYRENSFEGLKAYYRYVPKSKFSVSYTVRFNNEGTFMLPESRVEALYAPEMFGEIPNKQVEIVR
ncbi:alpha-2-macroglobulin family protein [Candidatus Magnetomonas plexicatena]|uniref:alpha-2-macroglobulin family protein n=1 Tax=Candidatus Magnetomonas plexicatena TaxID=2552947 RepID=UPI001C78CAE0|nr:alpha-2-macroglobulin [Nitrospirales bacterium LBB_01]